MAIINGNATRYDGLPVDYILLFNWSSGALVDKIVPSASGDWAYTYYSDISIGAAYISSGCQPVIHGPYNLIANGYRYWRVLNVITQGSGDTLNAMEGRNLRLINTEGFVTNNPAKTISSGGYGGDYDPIGAFDDTKNFAAAPDANGDRWIGYDFGVNVNVISISVSMHTIALSVRNWKSVDVQYSTNGIDWITEGTAYFNIVGADKSTHTSTIVK